MFLSVSTGAKQGRGLVYKKKHEPSSSTMKAAFGVGGKLLGKRPVFRQCYLKTETIVYKNGTL